MSFRSPSVRLNSPPAIRFARPMLTVSPAHFRSARLYSSISFALPFVSFPAHPTALFTPDGRQLIPRTFLRPLRCSSRTSRSPDDPFPGAHAESGICTRRKTGLEARGGTVRDGEDRNEEHGARRVVQVGGDRCTNERRAADRSEGGVARKLGGEKRGATTSDGGENVGLQLSRERIHGLSRRPSPRPRGCHRCHRHAAMDADRSARRRRQPAAP
jgi:hypothetical protein